jgi:Rrf2 family protein
MSVHKISERHHLPKRLLAEVLKGLARHGIVRATRGAAGGYSFHGDPDRTSLASIIIALEGPLELSECEVGGGNEGKCDLQQDCCIKDPVRRIYSGIRALLEGMTVTDLNTQGSDLELPAAPRVEEMPENTDGKLISRANPGLNTGSFN